MVNESRKPRHLVRAFALTLVASLALAAAGASTAGATDIQFAGEEGSGFTVSSSTGTELDTAETSRSCSAPTGTGSIWDEDDIENMKLKFNGCNSICPNESMVTSMLEMRFTNLPAAEGGGPIVVLDPVGTNVFAKCEKSGAPRLEGKLIGEITDPEEDEWSDQMTLSFQGEKGAQDHTKTLHGRTAGLDLLLFGKAFDVSLNFTVDLEFENEFELIASTDGNPILLHQSDSTWTTTNGFTLKNSEIDITCKAATTADTGEFSDISGTTALTFSGCKGWSGLVNCTTPGQKTGTVKASALPMRLTYLSDGLPGVIFGGDESESSTTFLEAVCFGLKVKVKGGVLAKISPDAFDVKALSLESVMNEDEGVEYTPEYTETEEGEKIAPTVEISGVSTGPASLAMSVNTHFFDVNKYPETEIKTVELKE